MAGLCMRWSEVLNALREPEGIPCTLYLGYKAAYTPPDLQGHAGMPPCFVIYPACSGRTALGF